MLLPYAFTHWQPGTPQWPVVVRVIGVVLIAVGGIVVAWAFARFAAEGAGVPIPGEPNSQRLTIGGPYRYCACREEDGRPLHARGTAIR